MSKRRQTTFTHFELNEGEQLCLCAKTRRSKTCAAPNCPPYIRYSKLMGLERLAEVRSRKPSASSESQGDGQEHSRLLKWLAETPQCPSDRKIGQPIRDLPHSLPKRSPRLVDQDGNDLTDDEQLEVIASLEATPLEEPLG